MGNRTEEPQVSSSKDGSRGSAGQGGSSKEYINNKSRDLFGKESSELMLLCSKYVEDSKNIKDGGAQRAAHFNFMMSFYG